MEKLKLQELENLKGGQIHAISIEEVIKLVAVIKSKKRPGTIEELAGKYRRIGQKLAREGKTSVDLIREAREEMYGS